MEGTIALSKEEQFRWRIIEDYRSGRIKRKEASVLLSISEKTVQRLAKRFREQGLLGLKHKNSNRTPYNAKSSDLKAECIALMKDKYFDFNLVHGLEMIRARHGLDVSYSVFRRWCEQAGVGRRKRRRVSKARVYRDRFSNEGLLLQMDGSHHKWNGKDEWVLIAAIDDATSEIPYAEFFHAEDTINCMTVVKRIIEIKGVPEALYVDKAGWFGGMKRQQFSQFVRACEELEIRVIYANSPQAKGRIERAWRTFQDRLIPELRLHGIKALASANEYTQTSFMPEYWQKQNTVIPRDLESRYRHLRPGTNLDDIFCMKHERKVKGDQTISFGKVVYKIVGGIVGSLSGKTVIIIERPGGKIEAMYGHLSLQLEAAPRIGMRREINAIWRRPA